MHEQINISTGSERMMPWVQVEISPGRCPFYWWFEVSYYDAQDKCWVHYYQRDGGAWSFWGVVKRAQRVMHEVWDELIYEEKRKKNPLLPDKYNKKHIK